MKTHELKLDIQYFDDVKSGKKNFEIRKNDRDFQVGDILELKAYAGRESAAEESLDIDYVWTQHLYEEGYDVWENCEEELADIIKVKVTWIIDYFDTSWESGKKFVRDVLGTLEEKIELNNNIGVILKEYFGSTELPDGYVILGIEVVK